MAQQRRYWRAQGSRLCPRIRFRIDLFSQLQQWRNEGEKLILLLDANENMMSGPLSRALQHPDLQMYDAIQKRTDSPGPPTFIRGSRQIDTVLCTVNLKCGTDVREAIAAYQILRMLSLS